MVRAGPLRRRVSTQRAEEGGRRDAPGATEVIENPQAEEDQDRAEHQAKAEFRRSFDAATPMNGADLSSVFSGPARRATPRARRR